MIVDFHADFDSTSQTFHRILLVVTIRLPPIEYLNVFFLKVVAYFENVAHFFTCSVHL